MQTSSCAVANNGTRTAIDSAGRIAIPKVLRDALGLTAGQPLGIVERGRGLAILPALTPMKVVDEGDGLATIAEESMPILTADLVREFLEQTRR